MCVRKKGIKKMKTNTCTMKVKEFIALSVLLLGVAPAAFAGNGVGENTFSIGPRASYASPKDADSGEWSMGAQARLHLTSGLALEGSLDYRTNNYLGNLVTVKTYPVQASLLAYLLPGGAVSPFLLGGAGWYYTQVDGPLGFSNTTSRFGLHAGVGLEIALSSALSIDGSYRYIWLESVTSQDQNALDKTFQDSGSMITMALNLRF